MKTAGLLRNLWAVFIVLGLLSVEGCVKRNLTIKSEPPGAKVYFDDIEIGETPAEHDFNWYTYHKVRLAKEGYKSVSELVYIKCPSVLWMPFDLFFEMIPCSLYDNRELSYTLTPVEEQAEQ